MTQPSGATPPAVADAATVDDDARAQDLLADAMSATDTPGDADKLGDAGKKALDAMKAQRNAATAEAKALRAKLLEYEERDKTDAQKLTDRAEAAEKAAAEAAAKLLRLEVAAEKGLTAKQAARLVGTTRDELEADADALLADFPATTAPAKPTAPKPDPSQGPKNPGPRRPGSLTDALKAHYATGTSGG